MTEPRSVVIDTSTLVGAVLRPDSIPRRAFLAALDNFSLCVSHATVDELREVLHRPKFDRYAPLQDRVNFLALVTARSVMWEIDAHSKQTARDACRDSTDAIFLALAMACKAQALVSSDADLLVLNPWQGISIWTPAVFLAQHGKP